LRSLLRFVHADGVVSEALAEGVPSVAHWRLSGLPQHLEPDQVRALFDACDRATPSGVRAFVILKLLVRLGCAAVRSLACGSTTSIGGRARS
jgi:integrase/recombinase XerD